MLYVPFSDFTLNLLGQPYDFTHLKDFTLVNLTPQGAVITFTRITVKGTCSGNSTVQTLPYGATSTPRTGASSGAAPIFIDANALASVMALSIGVLVSVLIL